MKTLITGGAGFIGSHLAEALCRRGADLIVLDNLSEGRLGNLAWRKSNDRLEFVQGDVNDEKLLDRILPGCIWVFHQAAMTSVPKSVAEPMASHTINVNGSLRLLAAARRAGVKRFFFASSSAVYGDVEISPSHEGLPPRPLSPYALQKYSAEKYCQLFHQLYGLETVSFRYFNVFGPRQSFNSHYSGVIARFCTTMLRGERPTIFGDGRQSRDFTFVDNVVTANLLVAEAPSQSVTGRVFNVGGGKSISILQLVEEINRLTGQTLEPRFEPARPGDVLHSSADISALQRTLGFAEQVTWREGLEQTLDFYGQSSKA
jgi:UDP-glucose 4-epimerase